MPLLDDEELGRMHARPKIECKSCGEILETNYCRECDVFFDEGHKNDCPDLDKPGTPYGNNHKGHRTY